MVEKLTDYRVLVVEDEFFLAVDIEDALTRAGAEVVGPIADVGSALARIRQGGFELAVLDINLGGDLAYTIGDELEARGVPFLFASAYPASDIPYRHRDRQLVQKPYGTDTLIACLTELVRAGRCTQPPG